MDRNALRPLRYTLTADNLLVVGSESGMVLLPEASIRKKGRLGPGQMIAVDLDEGVLYEDLAIKDKIADAHDYPRACAVSARWPTCPRAANRACPPSNAANCSAVRSPPG
jgi:hypothetical protein